MKPIEYCLDETLRQLVKIWNQPNPHDKLDATKLLNDFEVPLARHEFFKSLIKMLINDGYVEWLEPQPTEPIELYTYESRSWLTAKGFYFINEGGYTQLKAKTASENTRMEMLEKSQRRNEAALTWLTVVIAAGTLVAAIYYGLEIWKCISMGRT